LRVGLALSLLTFPRLGFTAEITSNGTGGGRWDDASTWRGKFVPTEKDEVVIAKDDHVVFDRNDDG
jgi:hypothetical protein